MRLKVGLDSFHRLEDKVIFLLSQEFPLSVKDIHQSVSRGASHKVSYQALHKLIQKLMKEGVLFNDCKRYSLHTNWLYSMKRFAENASGSASDFALTFSQKVDSRLTKVVDDDFKKEIQEDVHHLIVDKLLHRLDEWYATYYDPKKIEKKSILRTADFRNKRVLELGSGTGRISFQLASPTKSFVGVDVSEECVRFCNHIVEKKKIKNAHFVHSSIEKLDSSLGKFDIIISSWVGLHYLVDQPGICKKLHQFLVRGGKLIVLEAYQGSEYVTILDLLAKRKSVIALKTEQLKQHLMSEFGNLNEKIISTEYVFPSVEKVKETFKIELQYEGLMTWTPLMDEKIQRYLSSKQHPKTIGEMFRLIVCQA